MRLYSDFSTGKVNANGTLAIFFPISLKNSIHGIILIGSDAYLIFFPLPQLQTCIVYKVVIEVRTAI